MRYRNSNLSYKSMPHSDIAKAADSFVKRFNSYLIDIGYPEDVNCFISTPDLIDAVIRVDKREAYYYCFHGIEINERKQAALYAYWLLKFRPFRIIDTRFWTNEHARTINESFVIYMICSVLFYSNKIGPAILNMERNTFYQKLIYAFRYRDISMDAMLLLVDAMNTETFSIYHIDTV